MRGRAKRITNSKTSSKINSECCGNISPPLNSPLLNLTYTPQFKNDITEDSRNQKNIDRMEKLTV